MHKRKLLLSVKISRYGTVTANIPYVNSNNFVGLVLKGVTGAYLSNHDGKISKLAGSALLIDVGNSLAGMLLGMVGLGGVGAPSNSAKDMNNALNW